MGIDIARATIPEESISGIAYDDGNFIVGDGTGWVAESGNTARTSLGLGTGDTPTFTGLLLGSAGLAIGTEDTARGAIWLYGDNGDNNGQIRFYSGANQDTNTDYWLIGPKDSSEDFFIQAWECY